MKRSLLFILTIVTVFINACGNNDYANGTGSAAFHVIWPGSSEHAPSIHRAAPAGVLTVRVIVSALDMVTMQDDFPAAAGVGTVRGIPAGANRTFTILGLDASLLPIYQGEAYSINIVAGQVNDCGTVNLMPTTTGAVPAAPTGVTAVAGDRQVIVSWNYDVSYVYKVYWSTAPGVVKSSANRLLDGGGMNNYTHTGLTNGTTYYYVVTAAPMSSPGGSESVASVEVSATPQAGATIPVTGNASSVTDTSATINGSFTNPSGYTTTAWLEYGPTTAYGSSSGQTAYMQTGSINITASLTGLTEHTTYHYRTATQNSGGTFYGADSTFTTLYTARTLASGLTQPYRIAYDASSSSLFFTQNTSPNGTISMVSTSGTNSATAVISSLINPTLLAVDSTNVYWIEGSSSYQLKKAPKSGGTPTTLSTGLSSPYAIAVDSSSVYWTENVASGGGAVKKVSINGGTVVVLAAGLTYPRGLAIDFLSVYWVESYQSIKKIGINGGTVTVLVGLSDAADLISPSIALYQSYVYYSRYMSGEGLYRVSINGGSSTAIVSGSAGNIPNFVLDGSNVYSTGSSVGKVSLTDGTITQLSLGAAMSQGVVDPTNVYWADQVGGRIQYVPKN